MLPGTSRENDIVDKEDTQVPKRKGDFVRGSGDLVVSIVKWFKRAIQEESQPLMLIFEADRYEDKKETGEHK